MLKTARNIIGCGMITTTEGVAASSRHKILSHATILAYRTPETHCLTGSPCDPRAAHPFPRADDDLSPRSFAATPPLHCLAIRDPAARIAEASRARSSVGRAPPSHGGGHEFESRRVHSRKSCKWQTKTHSPFSSRGFRAATVQQPRRKSLCYTTMKVRETFM
jgi:hypothetical protein